MTNDPIGHFWRQTERKSDNECWPWLAGKNGVGYGVLYVGRRAVLAHRFSLALHRGHEIPKGLFVLHSCDKPGCVNPSHLRMGTQLDNMRDASIRKRFNPKITRGDDNWMRKRPDLVRRGSKATNAKLTEYTAAKLLQDRVSGASLRTLAKKYRLDRSTVADICNGATWAHVHGKNGAPSLEQLRAVPNILSGAKIDIAMAREIKKRLANGETGRSIALRYGLHFASISDIKLGKTWRNA